MGILFGLLVLTAIGVSFRYSSRDGIVLSIAMLVGSFATMIVFLIIDRDWHLFNSAIILVDTVFLVGFAVVAFRSTQRWPMLVCAMQFVVTMSHVAGLLGDTPASRVLGIAQGLWAYIQCFVIISGVMYNRVRTTSGLSLIKKS